MNVNQVYGWPEESNGFDMEGDAYYLPEDLYDDAGEYFAEPGEAYGLDGFDDVAELGEALREVLDDDYRYASPDDLQEALLNITEGMSPAEAFNFKQALGSILPVAGGILGTVIGGPAGTALGSGLGQVAAQAVSSSGGRRRRPRPRRRPQPRPLPVALPSPQGGSAAAAQLLQLTQNPDVLKSLLALAMGAQGKKSIPVGSNGSATPLAAITKLLGGLAKKATEDAEALLRESTRAPSYLQDSEGNYLVDPADPSSRAHALYEELADAADERIAAEAEELLAYP